GSPRTPQNLVKIFYYILYGRARDSLASAFSAAISVLPSALKKNGPLTNKTRTPRYTAKI
ncbi:MAG: hypothetical protein V4487_03345, partial [Chlamydiota bacterium]